MRLNIAGQYRINRGVILNHCRFWGLSLALAMLAAHAVQAAAPVTIHISTIHGKMKYDVESFEVDPGAEVTLIFKNEDEMQHNWLLLKPGSKTLVVAQKAWALGIEAVKKDYVPDMPEVLFHTKVVNPRETTSITFTAPMELGQYPYVCTLPGHVYSMKGMMRVGGSPIALRDLQYSYYEGEWTSLPDFSKLTPKKSAAIPSQKIDIAVAERADHFGMTFKGSLVVKKADELTFKLSSDDGSRLLVDGKAVIENDGIHPAGDPKTGKVAFEAGIHAFELQYFEATGEQALIVGVSGAGVPNLPLSVSRDTGPKTVDTSFHLHVMDKPLVIRAFVDGGPARSISVGLPGGVNYLFDPENCAVRFGWTGMFLDVGPDRGRGVDRGGGWCKILGPKFSVGYDGPVFAMGSATTKSVMRFGGYKKTGTPEFYFSVDGRDVTQKISATTDGQGLQYDFRFQEQPKESVFFHIKKDGLKVVCSAGQWQGDVLQLKPSEAAAFQVTVSPTAQP